MQFENSLWRKSVCTALFVSTLLALGCDKPASNSPAPAPVTPTSETSSQPNNQAVAATSPIAAPSVAPSVVLATPAPAQPVATALPGPTPIPLEGKDFEVTLLNGPKMKLSKVLGRKKIVVVNFWATWCGPCRKEIPDLIALTNSYQGKDVEILGLSVEDPAQALTAVKDFTKQSQINYKVGFAPMPMFLLFNGARPGGPIPQTFIFGKDGKLLYHIPGLRPAYKDYVQQAIDLALKS